MMLQIDSVRSETGKSAIKAPVSRNADAAVLKALVKDTSTHFAIFDDSKNSNASRDRKLATEKFESMNTQKINGSEVMDVAKVRAQKGMELNVLKDQLDIAYAYMNNQAGVKLNGQLNLAALSDDSNDKEEARMKELQQMGL
jgi:hypothetical protein